MAENESLDLARPGSRRWRKLRRAIQEGQSLEEIARHAEDALYGGVIGWWKQLRKANLSPQALLNAAASSTGELAKFLNSIPGRYSSAVLQRVAGNNQGCSQEQIARQFLGEIYNRSRTQIALSLDLTNNQGQRTLKSWLI